MKRTSDATCAEQPSTSTILTRRAALGSLAALVATIPVSAQTACSTEACGAYPELTEGPYYVEDPPERADITAGVEGTKLVLRITVVDSACAPIQGAVVDVWHAAPDGDYSTSSDGAMRGAQPTDADGIDAHDGVPGLVPRPHDPHSREDLRRRRRGHHHAALLR